MAVIFENGLQPIGCTSYPVYLGLVLSKATTSRACYAFCTIKAMNRCASNMAKATKCSPASVSDKRS